MRRYFTISRTMILMLLVAFSLTACKGQRAKVTLQKTQQIVTQLESLNASKHAPDELESVKRLVSQANDRLAAGEAGEALNLAKQARTEAEQLLIRVEAAEAADLWSAAEEDISVAETNSLNRLDPERYKRILELRDEANQARTQNEWRQVIQLSRDISNEVITGIAPIKNSADSERIKAESKLQELKSEGGPIYDPESVIDTQNTINRAIQRMEEDRDYVIAQSLFRDAVRLAEQGIENVQHAKGKEAIDEIEDLLAESLDEGAREFMAEEYENVISLLEKVITDFNDRLYSRVLEAAEDLRPRAQTLMINTKRKASDARIRDMKNDIDQLVQAGARQYLPGRVEQLDDLLAQSIDIREQNTEAAFDQIREIYQQHEDRVAQIDQEFSVLANDAIQLAANEIQTTQEVFQQVQNMFLPPESTPAGMVPFETAREARRVEIGQALENARSSLQTARQRVDNRQYRDAIQLAQEQAAIANNLLGEIYRLVAENAVIELSNLISRYERDGARIYAPDALERSVDDLQRVKDTINAGNFLEATEIAGAARSNIELMARQISGRAVEDIREAREVLEEVTSEKTQKYSAEALDRVSNLIDQAEQQLQEQSLKLAVERANEAIQLARQAQRQANQNAAEDTIDQALSKIERAEEAGAEDYAGRELESARKLIDQAESLYRADSYLQAEELALTAGERADQSFYKKINEAEAAIADAKAVGGWEYNDGALSRASANARQARQALEEGRYQTAQNLAEGARQKARSVARASKENNFREAIRTINRNLEEGREQGINYFQVQDSIEIRQRLSELENQWNIDDYDMIMAELTKLSGKLRGTLETTDDKVGLVANQQRKRLDRLVNAGAVDYASDLIDSAKANLKYAQIDFEKGQYKSAHSALEKAITAINEIQRRYDQESYVDTVEEIFEEYAEAQYKFRNVLTLDPAELKALAFATTSRGNLVALAGQSTPANFRTDVEKVYSKVLLITPPTGMERVHESVLAAINAGRIASLKFEKLIILNEFSSDEAEDIIDSAYTAMNESNQMIADLERQFFNDEVRVRLVSSAY